MDKELGKTSRYMTIKTIEAFTEVTTFGSEYPLYDDCEITAVNSVGDEIIFIDALDTWKVGEHIKVSIERG